MIGPKAALFVDWAGSAKEHPPQALYFFKDRQYIRWDVEHEVPFEGYPKDIADGWPGLLETHPGVALAGGIHVPGWNNKIYFVFKGSDRMAIWDVARHRLDPELVDVAAVLPSSLTNTGPFAPVYVDRDDTQCVYVFRGDEYTRFKVSGEGFPGTEDPGYPRKIGDGWTGGLTIAPTCAVSVNWPSRNKSLLNHKLYFFLGDLYTRWDITSHSNNYRLDIPSGWKGWPDFS